MKKYTKIWISFKRRSYDDGAEIYTFISEMLILYVSQLSHLTIQIFDIKSGAIFNYNAWNETFVMKNE